jgi:hypothetical protein
VFGVLVGKDEGRTKTERRSKKKKEEQQMRQLPTPVVTVNRVYVVLFRESGSLSRRWPRT